MNIRSLAHNLLWLPSAFVVFTAALFGQASDSIIVGTVTDSSGVAVARARITGQHFLGDMPSRMRQSTNPDIRVHWCSSAANIFVLNPTGRR